MEIYQKSLAALLSCAIRDRVPDEDACNILEWEKFCLEAEAHHVVELINKIIQNDSSKLGCDIAIKHKIFIKTLLSGMQQHKHMQDVSEVFQTFQLHSLPVIVLKGLVLRDLYPDPVSRIMSDSDILVHKEDVDRATQYLEDLGYVKINVNSDMEIRFQHVSKLMIELHWRIMPPGCIRNGELFEDTLWEQAVTVRVAEQSVLTLSDTDHFLHAIVHMLFHIQNTGFGLRQLCDLVLIIEKKGQNINWKIVQEKVSAMEIEEFVYAVLLVCKELLQLDIPKVFIRKKTIHGGTIALLIDDIFSAGVYGYKSEARNQVNNMVSFLQDQGVTRLQYLCRLFFPLGKQLTAKYQYARINPLLLPAAWVHRLIRKIGRKELFEIIRLHTQNLDETLPQYETRSYLLDQLNIRRKFK